MGRDPRRGAAPTRRRLHQQRWQRPRFPQHGRVALARAAGSAEARAEIRERGDLRIDALGSGTDYTAFLDHVGVATLDLGFGGADDGGVYHSIYDDFYWYTHFADTNFAYGVAMAQTIGTTVMRLAAADVLPFDFRGTADTVRMYLKELRELLKARQDAIGERNRQIEEGNWSWKDVGSAVLEVEAYDYEIANAKRFGLDEAMLRETVANRNDYYKQLPKKYRDRVDVANYRLDQADM